MLIRLTLLVEDKQDENPDSSTGLTEPAYERLMSAVADAGFGVESGPDQVYADADQLNG